MQSPHKIPSPTPEIQRQTMGDVFKDLVIVEKLLEQKEDPNLSNYIIIRLVTILEQFCREIVRYKIDKEHAHVPPEITIQTDDLNTIKDMSKGSIISISHNFQNVNQIKEHFKYYKIKVLIDDAYMKKIKELTDNRHNVVHTVSTIDYDAERGYYAVDEFMKRICKQVFTDSDFYARKGNALLIQDRAHEAVKCLDEGIKLGDKNAMIYINKGNALHFLGKDEEAVKCLDEGIRLQPKNGSLHLFKGLALQLLDRDKEAVKCFEEAVKYIDNSIAMNPQGYLYSDKGFALLSLRKNEEAVKCFDEAIRLWPKYGVLHQYKGAALQSLDKYEEAIKCFDEAIKLGRKDLIIYLRKGAALQSLDKYEEAIKCFDEAIKIEPDNPTAYEFIAEILRKQGKHDKAKEYDSKIRKLEK